MLTFLKENKQWLFSGIGVAIIMVGGAMVKWFVFDHRGEPPGSSTNIRESSKQRSLLTLEEFDRMRKDKALTELQLQDFIKKHEGRIVKWQGIVCGVEQSNLENAKSSIYVVYRPISQKDVSMPDLFTAEFPYTAKDDLFVLSEGDQIEFEGKVTFRSSSSRHNYDYSASLHDCSLLRYEKMTQLKEP